MSDGDWGLCAIQVVLALLGQTATLPYLCALLTATSTAVLYFSDANVVQFPTAYAFRQLRVRKGKQRSRFSTDLKA